MITIVHHPLIILYLQGDSDIIFADLDHDGDGKINFEDFSFGFRDFLTPGSRRGSLQLGLAQGPGSGLGVGGRVVEGLLNSSDVIEQSGVTERYLANAIISDKSK